MVIDWDDPTVQAILACPDGSQAWKMLDTYLKPVRDEIFAKRRAVRPKRGGRRTASQRERAQKLLAEAVEETRRMREDFEMEEEMMRQLAKYRHRSARQMCDRNAPFGARSETTGLNRGVPKRVCPPDFGLERPCHARACRLRP